MDKKKMTFPVVIGGRGVAYSLRDEPTDTVAAGSLNGTAPTPGPGGNRTVTDTNTKISVGDGAFSFATGAAANDGVWWDTLFVRTIGRVARATIIRPDAVGWMSFGWDADKTGQITDGIYYVGASLFNITNTSNVLVGTVAAATYKNWVIQRATGMLYFIQGGIYTKPTLLYPSRLSPNNRYVGVNARSTTAPFNAKSIRVPSRTFIQSPTIFDRFPKNLLDNFTRADGPIGVADSGQTWVQVPAASGIVEATISSNELVAADSGEATTAAYSGIDLGEGIKPSGMSAKIKFGAGAINGAAVLISNPNGLTTPAHVTGNSIHIVFASNYCDIAYWNASSYVKVKTITYTTPCALDGTEYDVSWSVSGNTITVNTPDGQTTNYQDTTLVSKNGRYCIFEHFWNTGAGPSRFSQTAVTYDQTSMTTFDGQIATPVTWTDQIGTFGRNGVSATCSALDGGLAISTVDSGKSDVFIEVDLTRTAGVGGICARYQDANNYLIAYHDGTNAKLDKVVAGVTTNLISAAAAYSAGKVLGLRVIGTTGHLFWNNANVHVVGGGATVPASTQTKHGLYTTDTGNTWDNFHVWATGSDGEYNVLDTL